MLASKINPTTTPDAALLELIIQTSPSAIVIMNAEGLILRFSTAAEKMFGYAEDEVVQRNVTCLMPDSEKIKHDQYLNHYLETGEQKIIGIGRRVKAIRKSGEIFVCELSIGEWSSREGSIFTGYIRDVSERVAAQRKIVRLQQKLDQVFRIQMLGEMSTALAHEINQPLSAISNFASAARRVLNSDPPDFKRAASHLDNVAEQALRAGEIVKRMRQFVTRGQLELEPDNINDIISEAVRVSRIDILQDGVDVHTDFSDDLPPVLADRIQIQQVVINLLRNAQEAIVGDGHTDIDISTTEGVPPGRIELQAITHGETEVIVTIKDSGPGLSRDLFNQIFDPFITGKPSGLGVGLAVCRTIVQAHGGKIWADSSPAKGAEFHFTLQAAPQS